MRYPWLTRRAVLLPVLLVLALATFAGGPSRAQEPRLGTVEFPTSARSQEAQAHFLRGVAALHSFWYPVALDEFRAAARIEPDFMMALWGEAMAHNHPVWGDPQDTEAARRVVAGIRASPGLTPRERAYLDAVGILYGPGEKPARDRAYAEAMERIHRTYPDDLEAAAFYSLALLGLAYSGGAADSGAPGDPAALRTRMRAAAVALEAFREEPDHPGAAHYVLHAFDDPDHAVLALPAARRYAEIAPAAPHALHMPSHIFLQLGMWPEAAASNEAAWRASEGLGAPDVHSLHWLLYAYLQQDRPEAARPLLAAARESLARVPEGDARGRFYGAYTHAVMAATFVVETGRWALADQLLPQAEPLPGTGAGPYQAFAALARAPVVFARGLAAAMEGSAADARRHAAELEAIRQQLAAAKVPFAAGMVPVLEIQGLEIAAAASAGAGDLDEAIRTMERAVALADAVPPPPGPPPVIKPAHELLGEMLLRAGRHEAAARRFATALFRHPNRSDALEGAARAARRQGDDGRQAVDRAPD